MKSFNLKIDMLKSDTKNQRLLAYSYTLSGNKRGNYERIKITICDQDSVLVKYENKTKHNEDLQIEEYKLPIIILEEIKNIFDKYELQQWNEQKPNKRLVADKGTKTYTFGFEDKDISISAQIFSKAYEIKLKEIDNLLIKYQKGVKSGKRNHTN